MKPQRKTTSQSTTNDWCHIRSDIRGGRDLLSQLERQQQETPFKPIKATTQFLFTPQG